MATWHELSTLQDDGRKVLVLDARSGDQWVSSHAGKPWKHDATHWSELPDASEVCSAWHADYKSKFGEDAYEELMAERASASAKRP